MYETISIVQQFIGTAGTEGRIEQKMDKKKYKKINDHVPRQWKCSVNII